MPRTRNVTREQWLAATTPATPSASLPNVDRDVLSVRSPKSKTAGTRRRNNGRSSMVLPTKGGDRSQRGIGREESEEAEDQENDENQENEPPRLVGGISERGVKGKKSKAETGKGKRGKRERAKEPLKDITELVVRGGNREESRGDGGPKGKKRSKHDHREVTSTTVTKSRGVVQRRYPSSLLPSSPPPQSQSQRHRLSSIQDPQHRNAIRKEIFHEQEEDDLPVASDDTEPVRHTPGASSDPFGFMVVERELKAKRNADTEHPRKETIYDAGGLILVPATSSFRTPVLIEEREQEEQEEEYKSPCATPPTPHKKRKRRKLSASMTVGDEEVVYSSRSDSMPSSPSPVKVREKEGRRQKSVYPPSEGSVFGTTSGNVVTEKEVETERRYQLRKRKKKEEVPEAEETEMPSDPDVFAQKLISNLPRGKKRKRNQ